MRTQRGLASPVCGRSGGALWLSRTGESATATSQTDRMICASLLLATLPTVASNAIWLEIDGAQARMAVLKDGLPLPFGDFAGLLTEARERIQRIEADAGSGM